jgi:hypothetical protein
MLLRYSFHVPHDHAYPAVLHCTILYGGVDGDQCFVSSLELSMAVYCNLLIYYYSSISSYPTSATRFADICPRITEIAEVRVAKLHHGLQNE